MVKFLREMTWIHARVKHLEYTTDVDFYKHPNLISEYVPDNYCGEYFDEDVSMDLPLDCSEEISRAYQQGYIHGYNRGLERIKPHGSLS